MPLSFTGPESFYSADEEAWWASVDKALKGASRQRLYGATDDGVEIAPLYARRTDTPARLLRAGKQDWSIVQRVDIADPSRANEQLLDDLGGGASGAELVFAGAAAAHGFGLRADRVSTLEKLFKGVQLNLIDLRIEAGQGTLQALALILAYLEKQGVDPSSVNLVAGGDPFSVAAVSAGSSIDDVAFQKEIRDTVAVLDGLGNSARILQADGSAWHNAGATPAQELALVLASAAAHLRTLEETGLPAEAWADRISLSLVADADQFGTIAKARAIRALWSCVLDGAGLPQKPAQLHMTTSYRMLTRRDPWVNLLRNTVATFAAGVGGADSVCVLPHTLAVGLPDAFARRLARNTQSILLEESSLSKVMDPAAGSGAIEDRTGKLCDAGWSFFQEIEAAGGIAQALRQGLVQERISDASAKVDQSVARRKRPITGVSEFPDLSEVGVKVLSSEANDTVCLPAPLTDLPDPADGQWFNALRKSALDETALLEFSGSEDAASEGQSFSGVSGRRIAEPFENLRSAADKFERDTDNAPTVFLATLGSLAQFTARATWTANAFAAGGFKAAGVAVYSSHDDLIAAFGQSGAVLACLVSSDDVYEAEAQAIAGKLKQAGAAHLYLAGKPGERETAYASAGIDTFLFAGCNLLDLLEDAHARLNEAQRAGQSGQEVLK
ncbi:methylmalonyl-CoA mutase family protein [Roseibium sp. SCPC15]|uniref:methylmalonyl-CoA mutase family protein n=1 Tax=Roseibium sp. SCP15 TaxID=3141376 RepID=UPI00333A821B